ncbi:MAG: hypothetical protein AAF492_06555 [Verrucomicrobiota bacterium]
MKPEDQKYPKSKVVIQSRNEDKVSMEFLDSDPVEAAKTPPQPEPVYIPKPRPATAPAASGHRTLFRYYVDALKNTLRVFDGIPWTTPYLPQTLICLALLIKIILIAGLLCTGGIASVLRTACAAIPERRAKRCEGVRRWKRICID